MTKKSVNQILAAWLFIAFGIAGFAGNTNPVCIDNGQIEFLEILICQGHALTHIATKECCTTKFESKNETNTVVEYDETFLEHQYPGFFPADTARAWRALYVLGAAVVPVSAFFGWHYGVTSAIASLASAIYAISLADLESRAEDERSPEVAKDCQSLRIDLSPSEAQKMKAHIESVYKSPKPYNLFHFQCVDFAQGALASTGRPDDFIELAAQQQQPFKIFTVDGMSLPAFWMYVRRNPISAIARMIQERDCAGLCQA